MGGNANSKIDFLQVYNIPNHILTLDEFNSILITDRIGFHKQMATSNVYAKIKICNKISQEQRTDPDFIELCSQDSQCSSYLDKYFVAELKTIQVSYPSSVGDIIWASKNYHEHWIYGVDLYEYDITDLTYKKLILKDFIKCKISDRGGYNMSRDLANIYLALRNLSGETIDKIICYRLNKQNKIEEIKRINDKYNSDQQINNEFSMDQRILYGL